MTKYPQGVTGVDQPEEDIELLNVEIKSDEGGNQKVKTSLIYKKYN